VKHFVVKIAAGSQFIALYVLAGQAPSNMQHDQHMNNHVNIIHNMSNTINNQQIDLARIALEESSRQAALNEIRKAEETARLQQIEFARIAEQRRIAQVESDRLASELAEEQRATQQRRQDLENQRLNGNIHIDSLAIDEVLDMFHDEIDPAIKEYWATMTIILDPTNIEALTFLRDVRGWTPEEIAGLNFNYENTHEI
jgi:hypothetical protein